MQTAILGSEQKDERPGLFRTGFQPWFIVMPCPVLAMVWDSSPPWLVEVTALIVFEDEQL